MVGYQQRPQDASWAIRTSSTSVVFSSWVELHGTRELVSFEYGAEGVDVDHLIEWGGKCKGDADHP